MRVCKDANTSYQIYSKNDEEKMVSCLENTLLEGVSYHCHLASPEVLRHKGGGMAGVLQHPRLEIPKAARERRAQNSKGKCSQNFARVTERASQRRLHSRITQKVFLKFYCAGCS